MKEEVLQGLKERVAGLAGAYHRLVLLVGPQGSGKTEVLRAFAVESGVRVVNVNLELSEPMLDLTERQRRLQLPTLVESILDPAAPLAVLDNTELLFDPGMQQDPLRLLQGLARNRTVIATWSGAVVEGHLQYAAADHPEFRRYDASGLSIVEA